MSTDNPRTFIMPPERVHITAVIEPVEHTNRWYFDFENGAMTQTRPSGGKDFAVASEGEWFQFYQMPWYDNWAEVFIAGEGTFVFDASWVGSPFDGIDIIRWGGASEQFVFAEPIVQSPVTGVITAIAAEHPEPTQQKAFIVANGDMWLDINEE